MRHIFYSEIRLLGKTRLLKGISLIGAITMLFFFTAQAHGITIKEEETISREVLQQVMARYQMVEDQRIADYINKIGAKILAGLSSKPFDYEFFVIQSDDYNAFAIPGGKIFIHSGLILAMENESELAGILGHEIAHIVCRHISARIDRAPKMAVMSLAGLIVGALLAAKGEGEVGQAVAMSSVAAGQTMALAYSREDEMQADQVGLKLLSKAGYHGDGLLRTLNTIRNHQLYRSGQIPTYMLTHPAIDDRILYLSSWMESQSVNATEQTAPNQEFERIRLRLLALYGDANMAAATFQSRLAANANDSLAHHGYGLLLAKMGRRQEAAAHLKQALETKAFDAQILSDIGILYFQDGLFAEALKVLEGGISIDPRATDSLFYLGRARQESGLYLEAIDAFESLRRIQPKHRNLFYFMGDAYGKSGNLGLGHYYLGVHYVQQKNPKLAEFHLTRALQYELQAEQRDEISQRLKDMGPGRKSAESGMKGRNFNGIYRNGKISY